MKKIFLFIILLLVVVYVKDIFAIGSGGGVYTPPTKDKQNIKPLNTNNLSFKNVICNNLKNMNERIKCRLTKTEDDLKKEPFMPEECRNLNGSKKIECLKLYKEIYRCFESSSDLNNCALKTVGLKDINPQDWAKECRDKKGKNLNICQENIRNKILNYIKVYLYHLSYKIEEVKQQNLNNLDEIVNFIALIETSKQKLNKANSKEVGSIIDNIDNKWNELIKKLKLSANFDKKSNLKELKTKHDMAMSAIRNIR